MLKKEFNKKDVQRARNLIAGNSGNSTGIQIGYKKEKINHYGNQYSRTDDDY